MTDVEGVYRTNILIIYIAMNLCHWCFRFSEYNQQKPGKTGKQHNVLPVWGNEQSMNLNPLILANIQGSSYFKGR